MVRSAVYLALVVILLVSGVAAPAWGVGYGEPGYVWPPSDWSAGTSLWDLYSDAQKVEIVRDYNLRAAMKWEQMRGSGVQTTTDLYRASGSVRTAAVDEAAANTLRSATVGDVSTATGVSEAEVSRRVIDAKLGAEATGLTRFAAKFGMTAGELVSSLSLASLYYSVGERLPRTRVHADGTECAGVFCENHTEPVYLNPAWGVTDPKLMLPGFDWSVEATGAVCYEFTELYEVPEAYRTLTNTFDVRPSAPYYAPPNADTERLVSLIQRTAYAAEGQPVVPYLSQTVNNSRSFGWFNRVTGAVYSPGYVLQWSDVGGVTTISVLYQGRVAPCLTSYDAQIDALVDSGLALEVYESPEETGTVPASGPSVPSSPFVGSVAGLGAGDSFSGSATLSDASEGVTVPEPSEVPEPVYTELDVQEVEQEVVQPLDVPFLQGWIGEVVRPILEPLFGVFDGLDIFWPFRFMAARG